MESKVRDTLKAMENDLLEKIASLKARLAPLERELLETRRALSALSGENHTPTPEFPNPLYEDVEKAQESPFKGLTMKQLAIKALKEHFPNGATANDLLFAFDLMYDRDDIIRSSLSPQLTRLKKDRKIHRIGNKWFLGEGPEEKTPDVAASGASGGEGGSSPSMESRGGQFGFYD